MKKVTPLLDLAILVILMAAGSLTSGRVVQPTLTQSTPSLNTPATYNFTFSALDILPIGAGFTLQTPYLSATLPNTF